MKWLLIIVAIFSILTIFELHKEQKQNRVSKKCFTLVAVMESIAAIVSIVLLFFV